MQEGGALGAYPAGVFKWPYEKIKASQDIDNQKMLFLYLTLLQELLYVQQIQRIPNLEIYVVNLFDPKENNSNTVRNAASYDFEWIKDRNIDIKLGNGLDAKTYGLNTDYMNLIEKLISLGDEDE